MHRMCQVMPRQRNRTSPMRIWRALPGGYQPPPGTSPKPARRGPDCTVRTTWEPSPESPSGHARWLGSWSAPTSRAGFFFDAHVEDDESSRSNRGDDSGAAIAPGRPSTGVRTERMGRCSGGGTAEWQARRRGTAPAVTYPIRQFALFGLRRRT